LLRLIVPHLETVGAALQQTFAELDPDSRFDVQTAEPPDDRARWYYNQVIRSAREAEFFTNVSDGTWWARLHLVVSGTTLRFGSVVQKVGHGESGVLAFTTFGEIIGPKNDEGERPAPQPAFRLTAKDSVTLVYQDTAANRWPAVAEAMDVTLAAAVEEFAASLG